MNTQIKRNIRSGLVLALALALYTPVAAHAGEWSRKDKDKDVPDCCKEMQEHRQAMAADQKAQDAALTEHVSAMNAAPADQKVDLMAAILTKMVEQRVAAHQHMEAMHDKQVKHRASCPMMKDKHGAEDKQGKADAQE